MLNQLTINNFAIVKFLELDFCHGMTSITGETGAGKSISIDALSLCLGGRAEASMIRPGASKAEISARFSLTNTPAAVAWLTENDLDLDNECILRRIITTEGRSRGYINGNPVPLSQMKSLGQLLVHIHGQHAHQSMLRNDMQLSILDNYAGHKELLRKVKDSCQGWQFLKKELAQLKRSQTERDARKQLLEYQVKELDEFAIAQGEFEELEQEHKKLANSGSLMEESQQSLALLYDGDEANAFSLLQNAVGRLESQADTDPTLTSVCEMLQEAVIQVQESSAQLRDYCDSLEMNPERFSYLDERMGAAMQLARKHQIFPGKAISDPCPTIPGV